MPLKMPNPGLKRLEDKLEKLENHLAEMRKTASINAKITSLAPYPLNLIREIPVVILPSGDDFIATFYDAGISASGDTDQEAVDGLRDILVAKFNALDIMAEKQLGSGPKRQIAVLRTFIKK